MNRLFRYALLLITLFGGAEAAAQENGWDWQQLELSRTDLDSLLLRYEEAAQSRAYSEELREQAVREATLIRNRLAEGDFQVGDQLGLIVEGEESLTGTFMVERGPALTLPVLGAISLRGVLRSELVDHLEKELARFIRTPVVQARTSVRLLVSGAVGTPGYHVIPVSTVLSDVLMLAGGPTANAELERISVERDGELIWSGRGLQQAIIEGRTLDQLSIRAGDHILVPEEDESSGLGGMLSTAATTVGPIVMLIGVLLQIF